MGPARQICHVVKLFHSDSCRRKSSAHFSMMSFLGMFVECGEKTQCHKPPILDTWYNPSKMVINVRTWGWLMFMALGKHHISWKAPVFRQFFFVFSQGVVFREHPMIRWAPKKKQIQVGTASTSTKNTCLFQKNFNQMFFARWHVAKPTLAMPAMPRTDVTENMCRRGTEIFPLLLDVPGTCCRVQGDSIRMVRM